MADELQASIDNGIKKIDDNNYEIDKSLVDKVLANPMAVAKGARVVPAVKNGKPDGFKLYAIRPSSVYAKLGLTNGDTLQSINGFELTSADKALEVYTKLREATSLEVEITRRGKPDDAQVHDSVIPDYAELTPAFDVAPRSGPRVVSSLAAVRSPQPRSPAPAEGCTPRRAGEDEALYSCKKRTGPVAVTFKPETELKDLITWVMGFTCKNFILDPRIVSTGKKVTVIAPNKMSAAEAYNVFLVALSTMGLTVVPKGNVLPDRRVGDREERDGADLQEGHPGDTDQVVRYILRPSYAQVETLREALDSIRSPAGNVQPPARC